MRPGGGNDFNDDLSGLPLMVGVEFVRWNGTTATGVDGPWNDVGRVLSFRGRVYSSSEDESWSLLK